MTPETLDAPNIPALSREDRVVIQSLIEQTTRQLQPQIKEAHQTGRPLTVGRPVINQLNPDHLADKLHLLRPSSAVLQFVDTLTSGLLGIMTQYPQLVGSRQAVQPAIKEQTADLRDRLCLLLQNHQCPTAYHQEITPTDRRLIAASCNFLTELWQQLHLKPHSRATRPQVISAILPFIYFDNLLGDLSFSLANPTPPLTRQQQRQQPRSQLQDQVPVEQLPTWSTRGPSSRQPDPGKLSTQYRGH